MTSRQEPTHLSSPSSESERDEARIRELIEQRAHALRTKNAAATMATQSPEYVQYPLTGPLQYAGATSMSESDFERVFAGFDGPIEYEVKELDVRVGTSVAVSRSVSHISATTTAGGQLAMWFRKTLVFEKRDGDWSIIHEHESVPIAADGTGAAATTLIPGDGTEAPPIGTSGDQEALSWLANGYEGFDLRTVTRDGVSLGYRIRGTGPTVVLVHGWPQSGYSWRAVAAELVRDHRVIVVDTRGAAGSDAPDDGYDKMTMADDLKAVLDHAGESSAHVVGHDIGLMIAYAFARRFPDRTATLTLVDGFVPGSELSRTVLSSLGPWHFGFHSNVALATAVITGNEAVYFDHFFDGASAEPTSISQEERAFYVAAARRPGALAAGFSAYEAATTVDATENAAALAKHGKLALPVLGIGGAASLGPYIDHMVNELADDHRAVSIAGAGHFLPEEAPTQLAEDVRRFISGTIGQGR